MNREEATLTTRSVGTISLVVGIWVILSPFIFDYTSGATINGVIVGIVVSLLAIVRLAAPSQAWASWLNGVAGLWLIVAPFIFGFTEPAVLWNEIIAGVVIAVLGFWNGTISVPIHHTTHHHAPHA